MGYIGSQPATNFETVRKQVSTTNSGTTITLDYSVSSVQDILVTVNAVVQSYDNYSVSGTTLTLGGTLNNDRVEILYVGRTFQTVSPAVGTVTNEMLSGSIANSKLATDPLNASNLASGTVPTARLGSGTASSSTVLFGDQTFKTAPSGTLVKVGDVRSNAAAGSHDLTGIFSDTYDKYFFSLSTFPITAAQYIYMQFLDSSNNPLTSGYYGAAYGLKQNGNELRHNDGGTSAIKLNEATSNGRAWQGQGYIVGPTSGITSNKGVTWQSVFYDGSNDQITQTGGYTNVLSTDATGMRIFSGVNLAAISLQVYGIVDTKHYNGS